MAMYDENEFMSAAEIPCEFCGLLWPIEIYVEHETGCRPDLTSSVNFSDYELEYNGAVSERTSYDFEYNTEMPDRSATQIIDDVLASEVQKLSATLNRNIDTVPSNQNKTASESVAKEPTNEVKQNTPAPIPPVTVENNYEPKKETVEVQMNDSPNESKQNEQDSTPPGTKGKTEPIKKFEKNNVNSPKKDKDIFNEVKGETLLSFGNIADTSKFLENEIEDNQDQDEAEDVEDINNLSDVDCDETLEEFWNRAKDFLNRQRVHRR